MAKKMGRTPRLFPAPEQARDRADLVHPVNMDWSRDRFSFRGAGPAGTRDLAPGTRLGPYEVIAAIGAGGMGQVYRARDERLRREVAIKILPSAFSADTDRLRRFEQEARAAAALNHPNILAVYDIGVEAGLPYIVSEFVDGASLRAQLPTAGTLQRNRAGLPISIGRVLDYAFQIASGLAAAHEKGIVHRDVKPENILVSAEGRVKILDFGLAKLADRGSTPTMTAETATLAGITGTPPYMSPEQAAGLAIDSRSDQFSFGVILYELLTGSRPFDREGVVQTLAAIIDADPTLLAASTRDIPSDIRRIIERCLQKDPRDRYRSTADLVRALRTARSARGDASGFRSPITREQAWRFRRLLAFGLLNVAAIAALWGTGRLRSGGGADGGAPRLRLTQITTREGVEIFPAWSADSSQLAYAAESNGRRRIFVRSIATGEERPLTRGSADEIQPGWSPDGRTVLFVRARDPRVKLEPGDVFAQYDDGDIWTVDVRSGTERKLVENAFNPAYSPDGRWIAMDASWAGSRRIWVVDDHGGSPRQISSDSSNAVSHVMPRWAPDGASIVFQNIERTKFDVKVVSVASRHSVWVTNDAILDLNPVWSPSGTEIYFSSQRGGGFNVWRIPVEPNGRPGGQARQITTGAGQDVSIAVSPDGKRPAFVTLRQNADVWRLPVSPATGSITGDPQAVVSTSREESRAAISPDGRWLAFNSDRAQDMTIWLHAVQTGTDRQLTHGPGGDYQPSWSPDGAIIAFFSSRSGNPKIWAVHVAAGTLTQLTHGASVDINPSFSPDGKLIAYQSDKDGRLEVWVMRSDGSHARQLTHSGVSGHCLRWSADGTHVIFRDVPADPTGTAMLMSVPVAGGDIMPVAPVAGGSHLSFSPSRSAVMDVVGHRTLWVTPLSLDAPHRVYAFADPDVRIDYPSWSGDGRWIYFDRFRPEGGDIWLIEGF